MPNTLGGSITTLAVAALLLPGLAAAQDRDTQEAQADALTDVGHAKHTQATKKLAALSGGPDDCDDNRDEDQHEA